VYASLHSEFDAFVSRFSASYVYDVFSPVMPSAELAIRPLFRVAE
jgi:hypothetical protein